MMLNGVPPRDPPTFMSCNVRRCLRAARGAKLTAREITTRIDCDPGALFEPSGAMMNVIRIVSQMVDRGEARIEMPTAARTEIAYWIEPPRDV